MWSSMEKTFKINPLIPTWNEEIRKSKTGQGEDYSTRCLLDYGYIKNHYRLIAADFSRQKEIDADPKAFQQIEFIG